MVSVLYFGMAGLATDHFTRTSCVGELAIVKSGKAFEVMLNLDFADSVWISGLKGNFKDYNVI